MSSIRIARLVCVLAVLLAGGSPLAARPPGTIKIDDRLLTTQSFTLFQRGTVLQFGGFESGEAIGSPDDGNFDLVFYEGAAPPALREVMRIHEGYVGIGTALPISPLHVVGSSFFEGLLVVRELSVPRITTSVGIKRDPDLSSDLAVGGTAMAGTFQSGKFVGPSDRPVEFGNISIPPQSVIFTTGTFERMRIDGPSGRVGIGTREPVSALQVDGDPGYLQIDQVKGAGPPRGADCDEDAERGRMLLDAAAARLYVCGGAARQWDYVALHD